MAAKSEKAGGRVPLTVSATVTGSDGATYTICGGSVDEVQVAVDQVKSSLRPESAGGEPTDIKAGG